MKTPFRIWTILAAAAILPWMGCSSSRPKTEAVKAVVVKPGTPLFVAEPSVPDSLDSTLALMGWGGGRFARELKKEILYQFNRRGVATVEDTAKAKASLAVSLTGYSQGEEGASRFEGGALLRTAEGVRRIGFRKPSADKGGKDGKGEGRAEAPERDDPALDNIRRIASSVVEGSRKDPDAVDKSKAGEGPEFHPPLMMIF